MWIILEEALLELTKYQSSCKLADVAAVHMVSKSEAYDLFEEVAKVRQRHRGSAGGRMAKGMSGQEDVRAQKVCEREVGCRGCKRSTVGVWPCSCFEESPYASPMCPVV